MAIISLIAAIDEQFGIGFHNQLLCHLPADLQYFKKITMGKPIIMGSATFESIGKPLPGRINIVLSHQKRQYPGVEYFQSLDDAILCYNKFQEIMIIGGAQVFDQSLALAKRLYITKIHHQFQADSFFPTITQNEWEVVDSTFRAHDEKNPYDLTFLTFEKK